MKNEPIAIDTQNVHATLNGGRVQLKLVTYSDKSRRFFYKNQLKNDDFLEITKKNAAILCTVAGHDFRAMLERFTNTLEAETPTRSFFGKGKK